MLHGDHLQITPVAPATHSRRTCQRLPSTTLGAAAARRVGRSGAMDVTHLLEDSACGDWTPDPSELEATASLADSPLCSQLPVLGFRLWPSLLVLQ
jgi:hypothetical protein